MTQPTLFEIPARPRTLPSPPIAPSRSRLARHCSAMGAQAIVRARDTLWRRMLDLYRIIDRTDAELARQLGVRESTISARRSELLKAGLVESAGYARKNPRTGVNNAVWKVLG